jgi:ribosome-associated translation inhibitor RaiA
MERNGAESSPNPRHARRRGPKPDRQYNNAHRTANANPSREQLLPMSVKLTGDTLALDSGIRGTIEEQATQLRSRFPGQAIKMTARIAEEFDQLNGHRVRFELIASLADRQQIIVREARKSAEEAMASAFRGLKSKLRQISLRTCMPNPAGQALQVAGT